MTLASGRVPHSDRIANGPMVIPTVVQPSPPLMSENFAKDSIIAWFRGEFAAANAIIDALCNHLTQLEDCAIGGGRSEYETVFAAIHRRRLNWIPILQMQKFYPIADVAVELQKVAAKKSQEMQVNKEAIKIEEGEKEKFPDPPISEEEITVEFDEIGNGEVVDGNSAKGDLPETEITNTGSQAVQTLPENAELSCDHNGYEAPRDGMKITKGFTAKEPVKGHLVNVVRGLKLYEDVFTESELSKLSNFVDELRVAGRDGQLSGDTFILYNQSVKGNKREMIQLGVPIFGHIQDEAGSNCQKNDLQPIPALLEGIIEHLIQWHIISESRRPNGCIINFFDEGEFSQPFLKPPHVDQPISTLLLSESTMAFGRTLVNDNEGNYRGPLVLSLKEGSLLVMRGNSSDVARHVMCSSPNKRVSITFVRIRVEAESNSPKASPLNKSLALWHPGVPTPHLPTSEGTLNGFGQVNVIPKWAPLVMLAPLRPMVVSPPRKITCNGTGVFLPWTVGPKKPARHLPPRAQKGRALTMISAASDACNKGENVCDTSVHVEQKVM